MESLFTITISSKLILQYLSFLIMGIVFIFGAVKYSRKINLKSFAFNRNHFLLGLALAIHVITVFLNAEFKSSAPEAYAIEEIEVDNNIIPVTHWPEKKIERVLPPPLTQTKVEKLLFKPIITSKVVQKPMLNMEITSESAVEVNTPLTKGQGTEAEIPLPQPEDGEPVVIIPERMPRFPGCEDIRLTTAEREACAKKELLKYMHSNIKYPEVARSTTIEGTVVIQFVVSKTGEITDAKIVRDIGGGCGQEALRVVNNMNKMDEKWTPGKQRAKPVNVLFTLPINFKLGN